MITHDRRRGGKQGAPLPDASGALTDGRGAPGRIRTHGRALHGRQFGIEFLHALDRQRNAFDLESEVIETAAPSIPQRDIIKPDLAIPYRRRARGTLSIGGLHTEERLIKPGICRIIHAADGEVIDLGKHATGLL